MSEPTKQEKLAIIELQDKELAQQIYDAVIRRKVAARVDDKEQAERIDKVLEKLEKRRAVLEEIKNSVEKE